MNQVRERMPALSVRSVRRALVSRASKGLAWRHRIHQQPAAFRGNSEGSGESKGSGAR